MLHKQFHKPLARTTGVCASQALQSFGAHKSAGSGFAAVTSHTPNHSGTKIAVQNDAQRANQAIFMSVYHWGIHGWVPYILLALSLGVVSFRWGMPPAALALGAPGPAAWDHLCY